jgi:glyoxylase-like metal-dependent hydrolase (beta-lactamase superfamily II)
MGVEVAPKIFRYRQGNGISYVIEDEKTVQIDAGAPTDKKPEVIVLTHSHFDHTAFMPRCEVWASAKCAKHISVMDGATLVKRFGVEREPIEVTRVLKDGDTIDTGTHLFRVIETPGHTDGSICLYEENVRILFSGDTLFDDGILGRTDLPTGSEAQMKESINKLSSLNVDVLLPGHV